MIHRDEHNSDFSIISNEIINDRSLSAEAFRLLIFMLSCSDEWKFSLRGLSYCFDVTERTISAWLSELKRSGYVTIKWSTGGSGRFESSEWEVFENPQKTEWKNNRNAETLPDGSPHRSKTASKQNRDAVAPQRGNASTLKQVSIETNTNTKQVSKENKERDDFSSLLAPLSPDLRDTFEEFVKMRKKIKAPLTEKALELAIKKAEKLGDGDEGKMKAIVEQSILNSWKGLFELKDRPKAEPIIENPFTRLLREEGYT